MAEIYRDSFPNNVEYWGTLFDVNLGALVNVVNGGQGKPIRYKLTKPVAGAQQQILALEVNNIEYRGNAYGSEVNNHPFVLTNRFQDTPTDDIVEGAFFVRQDTKYNIMIDEEPFGMGCTGGWNWNYHRFPFGFMYKDSNDVIHTIGYDAVTRDGAEVSWHAWYGDYSQPVSFDSLFFRDYIKNSQIVLKVPYKMFKSEEGARQFLKYGDDSDDANKGGDDGEGKDREYVLYYYADIYRTQFSHRSPSQKVARKKIEFVVKARDDKGETIPKFKYGVIGVVDDENPNGYYNVKFEKDGNIDNVVKIYVDGQEVSDFNFGTCESVWSDNFKPNDGAWYYYARVQTNIKITSLLGDALQSAQGDDLEPMEFNDNGIRLDTGMSETYILTNYDLHRLAECFNVQVTSDGGLLSSMFVGMSMHQNPIDCCIDLFALPFDANEFCTTATETIDFNPVINNPTPSTTDDGDDDSGEHTGTHHYD